MPSHIDATYIGFFAVAVGYLVFLVALHFYFKWENWDHQRRSQRLVHRNLQRMAGR